MRKISVSHVEKGSYGDGSDKEYIKSLNHKRLVVPISHALFDHIKNTLNDYIYIVRFTGTVWRKTKRKDYYEYYDEDNHEWLVDSNMDDSYLEYMDWGETLNRFVK
ncbi:hypothetical protein Q6344_09065 [Psychrobacter cibarius]|nr:hypothetical protein Q6344_09065 [Psychrobacter cibarius]